MGRREVYHDADHKALSCGVDHACGLFLQVWDTTKYRDPDDENILVDLDAVFDGLTVEELRAVAGEHGFTADDLRPLLAACGLAGQL